MLPGRKLSTYLALGYFGQYIKVPNKLNINIKQNDTIIKIVFENNTALPRACTTDKAAHCYNNN